MANEYIQKEWTGGAPATTLVADITSGATSFAITAATGWPTGAADPFVIAVDAGQLTEEKMLVTRTGTTINVVERGYDNTSAQAHTANARVAHVLDAYTIEQVNRMVNLPTTQGDMVYRGAVDWERLAVSTAGKVLQLTGSPPVPTWQEQIPAGSIRWSISTTEDDGWKFFGQTLVGAQTAYPALWAKAPASWKSGADLILPSIAGRGFIELDSGDTAIDAIGEMVGAKDAIVVDHNHTTGAHTHGIDHNHPATETDGPSVAHAHGVGTLAATSTGSAHFHIPDNQTGTTEEFLIRLGAYGSETFRLNADAGGTHAITYWGNTETDGTHGHSLSGSTANSTDAHTHTLDLANFTGSTNSQSASNTGPASGAASATRANYHPVMVMRAQIKVH